MTAGPRSPCLRRLKRRAQFLGAARGQRVGRRAFGLQVAGLQVAATDEIAPGVGFTVTKKTGNAPARNRIKRRLRAASRTAAGFVPGHDYVLVGRREALDEPFTRLVADLNSALAKAHARGVARPGPIRT